MLTIAFAFWIQIFFFYHSKQILNGSISKGGQHRALWRRSTQLPAANVTSGRLPQTSGCHTQRGHSWVKLLLQDHGIQTKPKTNGREKRGTDGWMDGEGVSDDADKKALMINHQFKTSPTQINRKRSRRGGREVLGIFSVILSDLDLRTYLGTSTSSSMKRSGSPSQLRSPPNLLRRDSWERTDAEWNLGGSFDWKEKNKWSLENQSAVNSQFQYLSARPPLRKQTTS